MSKYKYNPSETKALKKKLKVLNQRLAEIEYNNPSMKKLKFYQTIQDLQERNRGYMKTTTNKLGETVVRFRTDLQSLTRSDFNSIKANVDRFLHFQTSTKIGLSRINSKGYQTFINSDFAKNKGLTNISLDEYLEMWGRMSSKSFEHMTSDEKVNIYKKKPAEMETDDWVAINEDIASEYKSVLARRKALDEALSGVKKLDDKAKEGKSFYELYKEFFKKSR